MSRVGDGENNGRQAGWIGGEECAGDGLESCAGGEDIVNDEQAFAFDELWFAQGKCAAHIRMTGLLGSLRGLLLGVADAGEGLDEREVGFFVQPHCDQPGLIVSARELAAAMKRDRHDRINVLEERGGVGLLEEAIGEPLGQRPFSVVFELVDDLPDRLGEDAQPSHALVGIQTFAQTPWTRGVGLRQRHRAMNAPGGHGKLVKF